MEGEVRLQIKEETEILSGKSVRTLDIFFRSVYPQSKTEDVLRLKCRREKRRAHHKQKEYSDDGLSPGQMSS